MDLDALVMFRKTFWRHTVSDVVHLHQDQALSTTIFILKEFGPTGFLLKEEGESKKFKVCLGNPHTCSCLTYVKERDLCKHICWVLIRKFRLPRDHEYCLQLGLVDRQISEMLQGVHSPRSPHLEDPPTPVLTEEDGCVKQKEVEAEDVCPICQEDLMGKRLPVTYCRYGCGNNVHISCMKVWADHQARSDPDIMVKCPLCREAFEPMKVLLDQVKNAASLLTTAERERQDKHLGVLCNGCKACPVTGKCFKCVVCSYYHLCEACFQDHCHPQHPFAFRAKRSQRWVSLRHSARQKSGDLQEWDPQSTEDQDSVVRSERVPEQIVKSLLPVEVRQGSKLLKPGQQCRLCLKSFCLGQQVKHLPCHHKFHADCADAWLLQSNSCPLDRQVIYNPLTWQRSGKQLAPKCGPGSSARSQQKLMDQLFIPGQGLQLGPSHAPSAAPPVPLPKEPAANGTHEPPVKSGDADDSPEPRVSPPLKDRRAVSRRDSQSRERSSRDAARLPAAARAGCFARSQRLKRGGKSAASASVCADRDRDRPERGPFVGLSGLEMQVHSREMSGLGRTQLQKRPSAPRPVPAPTRGRGLVIRIAEVLSGSPHVEVQE
ncbi:E3 ubiquitin-protein ligase ZSWIM2 isoform X1 [Anguilla anguilla]|uniref:E3 ubiquitin-protein ligase ZSWIM2 isoform X1 n=2 Tax=Anguilla anguilla TaxID=7936 RepID=UPI0015B2E620|nr:E3 ubiquitin-protein ligase ZSWIM2 isoform X1 [Anguilla anguilla]